MGKNKLQHFEENKTFPNFFQPTFDEFAEGYKFKGKWNRKFFNNSNPVVLELGCGKGEYSVGLAKKYPDKNFIGIDRKGARMWRGAKDSQLEEINNVAFLRTKVEQLSYFFGPEEISEIWITFPDPLPKKKRIRKRLTSPNFLNMYREILAKGGIVHLKTDNLEFFEFSLQILSENGIYVTFETYDLYDSGFEGDASSFYTYYEKKFLADGVKINYLNFEFEP